jgi:hypothetical protein
MGKDGPAFLAYANFQVFLQWNSALVYSTTAAYFATRLAGSPVVGRGRKGGRKPKMTTAKVRLAAAAMGKPETNVARLCEELGISSQTL